VTQYWISTVVAEIVYNLAKYLLICWRES